MDDPSVWEGVAMWRKADGYGGGFSDYTSCRRLNELKLMEGILSEI